MKIIHRTLLAGLLMIAGPQAVFPQDKQTITAELLPQAVLNKVSVPPGDYSGISFIRPNLYAVVSDKEAADGFYPFTIQIDSLTGKLTDVHRNVFVPNTQDKGAASKQTARDAEDIVYHLSTNTYFIAAESDQRIIEYADNGIPTGRELQIPAEFGIKNIQPNYGFESLAYDSIRGLFWTTTESALLKDQGAEGQALSLRLQSFGENLKPRTQYAYRTDMPSIKPEKARQTFGVSAITALPDGRLLVLERDFVIPHNYIRSYVRHKIYIVDPLSSPQSVISADTDVNKLPESRYLKKTLLTEFQTNLKLFDRSLANYEGMCLGPTLQDGRRVLFLINDSQHNYGNMFFHLQDYLKVILLKFQ